MGFFDKIKEAGKTTFKGIGKTIKKQGLIGQRNQEVFKIKEKVLINLSIDELKRLAYLLRLRNLEYVTKYDDNLRPRKVKIKLSKFDYVEKIAKLPSSDLVLGLKSIKKSSLADEMQREISFIVEGYEEQIKNIGIEKGESEQREDIILNTIVETITRDIISISPERWNKERDYQIELLGSLKHIKKDFPKFDVSITPEYKTETNKRIDLLIQVGSYRIGIELKFNLIRSNDFQRLMGQVLEYSGFLDALFVVQFYPLESEVGLNNLNKLKNNTKIPLKVIANGVIKI